MTDGAGTIAECVVTGVRPGVVELAVLATRAEPAAEPRIVVVQAIPKGDRGELAVEIMTEVGVDAVVAWQAERCVARWRARPGRQGAGPLAGDGPGGGQAVPPGLDPRGDRAGGHAGHRAPGRRGGAGRPPRPRGAGHAGPHHACRTAGEIVVIVGPEGGVSPAEADTLTRAGAVAARLGPTVLRSSSAGAVAAAVALARSARWP